MDRTLAARFESQHLKSRPLIYCDASLALPTAFSPNDVNQRLLRWHQVPSKYQGLHGPRRGSARHWQGWGQHLGGTVPRRIPPGKQARSKRDCELLIVTANMWQVCEFVSWAREPVAAVPNS